MGNAEAIALFEDLVRRDDAAIHLPAAALAMARIAYPNLALAPHLANLSDMGRLAAERLRGVISADDRIARLNHYLFSELGFEGNRKDYYDPRNSFLNEVLDRRLGLPITLSLVYIEIAAACRVTVEGIGFPGHFLVRDVATGWILDVFNGGRRLEVADCRDMFVEQGFERREWTDTLLVSVTKKQFLLRMINNLRRPYAEADDTQRLGMLDAMAAAAAESSQPGVSAMLH
jgi:regulator of sirC expression with transglutaminase-like and TPR domain